MSINTLFITTAIAALGVSSVATSANAQSSRYGGGDVYSYESGSNCNTAPCGPVASAPAQSSRYGGYTQQAPMQQAPVYVDCAQMGTCGPQVMSQPRTVYTQPAAPVYQQPQYTQQAQYSQPMQQMAPVNCPAGTTAQPDGTCMEGATTSTYSDTTSYGSSSSYGSTSSYNDFDVVMDSAPMAPAMPVNCPAGTTAQNDGTCMQGSSYSGGYDSTSTYSAPTTSYDSGSVYSGDAASSSSSYGYTSDGGYSASDYLPVRK